MIEPEKTIRKTIREPSQHAVYYNGFLNILVSYLITVLP